MPSHLLATRKDGGASEEEEDAEEFGGLVSMIRGPLIFAFHLVRGIRTYISGLRAIGMAESIGTSKTHNILKQRMPLFKL